MKIIFVRHGQAENNVQHVAASALDAPHELTALGRRQIKGIARNPRLNVDFTAIYVSPLKRTQQTYQILAKNNSRIGAASCATDQRLREINMGKYEGRVITRWPVVAVWAVRYMARLFGGSSFRVQGGESFREMARRLADFMADAVEQYSDSDTILAISHGDTILEAKFVIRRTRPDKNSRGYFPPTNAEIVTFNLNKSDLPKLRAIAEK